MEKMSSQPQRSSSIAPLARDADGNLIELPDGAAGWRIRRQTGGRPRLVLDSRKQPMLFPLDYTIADVGDVLAPGNYLLDAVDRNGEPLGVTIAVSIGMLRNAEAVEPDHENVDGAPAVVPTTLPSTTSDVRLVLEANVRATQMAFIHNQRTLETGLRMAETLRDSVQVLATSQADWIKSVSSSRGFFRNAAPPMAPVEVKQLTVNTGRGEDDGDDDDEDGGDEHADGGPSDQGDGGGGGGATPHWSEQFMPLIQHVITQVMPAINAWSARQWGDAVARHRSGAANGAAVDARGIEAKVEEQGPAQAEQELVAKHEHAAKLEAAVAAAATPGGINVLKLLQLLPQTTASKLMQIQAGLPPEDQMEAMQILRGYSVDGMQELMTLFDAASVAECDDFIRRLVAERRRLRAERLARATPSSPEGSGTGGAGGTGGHGSTGP
jgi:hypothetical protein